MSEVETDIKHPLISSYLEKGLDWRMGASTLGLDIDEANKIVREYNKNRSSTFVKTIDSKIELLVDNINYSKIAESSLGDISRTIGELYKIKRLEAGESTDNVSVIGKILGDYSL